MFMWTNLKSNIHNSSGLMQTYIRAIHLNRHIGRFKSSICKSETHVAALPSRTWLQHRLEHGSCTVLTRRLDTWRDCHFLEISLVWSLGRTVLLWFKGAGWNLTSLGKTCAPLGSEKNRHMIHKIIHLLVYRYMYIIFNVHIVDIHQHNTNISLRTNTHLTWTEPSLETWSGSVRGTTLGPP